MTTRKALRLSINHWKRMASGKRRPGEDHRSESCALCWMYADDKCEGCPIAKAGFADCESSPDKPPFHWEKANDASLRGRNYDGPEFKRAARGFVKFLEGLKP